MSGAYLRGEQAVDPRVPTRRYSALMKARITREGAVLVKCPYCLLYFRDHEEVHVTRFTDAYGKREVTTYCRRGHKLRFRSIDQWREERMKAGLQKEP